MDIPLQVNFRNMEPSPAVETRVREKAAKLEKYFHHLTSCRVVVEAPHRHHHKGKIYHVRIEMGVPRKSELVVSNEREENHAMRTSISLSATPSRPPSGNCATIADRWQARRAATFPPTRGPEFGRASQGSQGLFDFDEIKIGP